jgi:hypothetical protein
MKRTITMLSFAAFVAAAGWVQTPSAVAATPSSDFCKRWYNDIRSKPAKRAMALSTNGKVCHSVWGESSQAAADRAAVAGCQENGVRKCKVVRR